MKPESTTPCFAVLDRLDRWHGVSISSLEVSVEITFSDLADTFDYKWRMSQGGIILMTKRFQGSKQLPQIHLAEMQQMSRDINNALTLTPKIDYATPVNPKLRQLLLSLSSEQYHAITGDQPFYIRDLPRKQMEPLIECMWQSNFAAIFRKWETLPSLLNGFPRSYFTADPSLTHGETTIEDDKRITKMYIDVLHNCT